MYFNYKTVHVGHGLYAIHIAVINLKHSIFSWTSVTNKDKLFISNFQTKPFSQCSTIYFNHNVTLSRGHYCAYTVDAEKNCKINRGAAIQTYSTSTLLPNIVGLLSIGLTSACNSTNPELFTRVAYYTPWIESIVWPDARSK